MTPLLAEIIVCGAFHCVVVYQILLNFGILVCVLIVSLPRSVFFNFLFTFFLPVGCVQVSLSRLSLLDDF